MLGKRDQTGEVERGEGGGGATPRLGVGCSEGNGKREFTRDSDGEMGMMGTEEGRQGRKVRI